MAEKTPLQKDADKIHKRVLDVLANQMGIRANEVLLESTANSLGADSLDTVEIIMALEEEFETELTDREMEKISTVNDTVVLLLRKLNKCLTDDDTAEAMRALRNLKTGVAPKKPAPKAKLVPKAEEGTRKRHLDHLFEYTICEAPLTEFTKAFHTVFQNPQQAFLSSYKTSTDSDAWRIQMTGRLTDEAVDDVARFVEESGFAFVKSTEHMVQLHNSTNFGIVTAIHLSLITYGL